MKPAVVRAFVDWMGLDGVDIDYEEDANCVGVGSSVSCQTDAQLTKVITDLRAALPAESGYILSAATWSVGAFGEGAWAAAQPIAPNTGMWLRPLQAAGAKLDQTLCMSYDASNAYSPQQAYDAYRAIYKGKIMMGIEVAPEAWGGHVITTPEAVALAAYVKANGGSGIMLWALSKQAQANTPSAQVLSTAVCTELALGNCSAKLLG